MTLVAIPIEQFGGLDLRDDPGETGLSAASDILNIRFDSRGRVASRYGYSQFAALTASNPVVALAPFYKTDGTKQLLVCTSDKLHALNTSGATVATAATDSSVPVFVRTGTPTAERIYITRPVGPMWRWDGAAFTSVATSPGDSIAAAYWQTRLVVARYAIPSRVQFSNAGDPETFTYAAGPPATGDYVDLSPGDGERIQGMVTYRDSLIVFKESQFFVFFGTSTDSTGGAVFNYRAVDANVGMLARNAYAVAPEGVYFLGRDGIYLTNGGDPTLVSDAIGPLFRGESSTFTGATLDQVSLKTVTKMKYFDGTLYVALATATGTGRGVLVYRPRTQDWSWWDVPAQGLNAFSISDRNELVCGVTVSGSYYVARLNSSNTNDWGSTPIATKYQSGYESIWAWARRRVHSTAAQSRIRQTHLWGSGTPTWAVLTDYATTDTQATAVTLGTAPTVSEGYDRGARRGKLFAIRLSGSAPWMVARIVLDATFPRDESAKTA